MKINELTPGKWYVLTMPERTSYLVFDTPKHEPSTTTFIRTEETPFLFVKFVDPFVDHRLTWTRWTMVGIGEKFGYVAFLVNEVEFEEYNW